MIKRGKPAYASPVWKSTSNKRINPLAEEENLRLEKLFKLLNEPYNSKKKEVLRELGEYDPQSSLQYVLIICESVAMVE